MIECLSVFLSKENLRWRELATTMTSECIRRFENAPILLTCTCHWADLLCCCSYYPVHFVSHFIYGHQSRPQTICHVYTYIYAHARAQQLTLHSGCGVCSLWPYGEYDSAERAGYVLWRALVMHVVQIV